MKRINVTGMGKRLMLQGVRQVKRTPLRITEPPELRYWEPMRIGELLKPLQLMIGHPDRNRLMALFFKDYK